jgi:hypothetical protein
MTDDERDDASDGTTVTDVDTTTTDVPSDHASSAAVPAADHDLNTEEPIAADSIPALGAETPAPEASEASAVAAKQRRTVIAWLSQHGIGVIGAVAAVAALVVAVNIANEQNRVARDLATSQDKLARTWPTPVRFRRTHGSCVRSTSKTRSISRSVGSTCAAPRFRNSNSAVPTPAPLISNMAVPICSMQI